MPISAAAVPLTGPPATLIYNDWYPAMRSEALEGKRMSTAMLMGIPLVLGRREDGQLFAMRDLCPHRGIPLSCGWFDGKALTCKYHGWVFEPVSGKCMEIPSLTKDDPFPRNLHGMAYPCDERDGYAWVYVPEAGRGRVKAEDAALSPVPEVPKFGARYRSAHLTADLPCNVDHGIIGLMDPAHGPFVHQAWWWRKQASIHEKEKKFEPIPQGFRMATHAPSANSAPYKLLGVYGEPITTTIDFVLPNRRYETIRCGDKWFSSLTTVTPTTPSDLPDRCVWRVERAVSLAVHDVDPAVFREHVRAAGSGDDDPTGGRIEVRSGADADRRCGQAGEMVLRAEAGAAGCGADRGADEASDGWAGDFAVEKLKGSWELGAKGV